MYYTSKKKHKQRPVQSESVSKILIKGTFLPPCRSLFPPFRNAEQKNERINHHHSPPSEFITRAILR